MSLSLTLSLSLSYWWPFNGFICAGLILASVHSIVMTCERQVLGRLKFNTTIAKQHKTILIINSCIEPNVALYKCYNIVCQQFNNQNVWKSNIAWNPFNRTFVYSVWTLANKFIICKLSFYPRSHTYTPTHMCIYWHDPEHTHHTMLMTRNQTGFIHGYAFLRNSTARTFLPNMINCQRKSRHLRRSLS